MRGNELTSNLELSKPLVLRFLRDPTDSFEQECDIGFGVSSHLKLEVGGIDLGLQLENVDDVPKVDVEGLDLSCIVARPKI